MGSSPPSPWLNQYWHPHILGATVTGSAVIDGERYDLDGATAYAEKNWGAGFPKSWWWGQAHGFERDDVCVSRSAAESSNGDLPPPRWEGSWSGSATTCSASVPLRHWLRGSVDDGVWAGCAPGDFGPTVEIEADGAGTEFLPLPVPLPEERRNVDTDFEHLGGRLQLRVRRDGRVLFEGETTLAGLEIGSLPGTPL